MYISYTTHSKRVYPLRPFSPKSHHGPRRHEPCAWPPRTGKSLTETLKKRSALQPGMSFIVLVCWLLNVLATCKYTSETDLLNCRCCHTETKVTDQTFCHTQPRYSDTRPTSPGADPIRSGVWRGSQWNTNLQVTDMTRPVKRSRVKAGTEPRSAALEADAFPPGLRGGGCFRTGIRIQKTAGEGGDGRGAWLASHHVHQDCGCIKTFIGEMEASHRFICQRVGGRSIGLFKTG